MTWGSECQLGRVGAGRVSSPEIGMLFGCVVSCLFVSLLGWLKEGLSPNKSHIPTTPIPISPFQSFPILLICHSYTALCHLFRDICRKLFFQASLSHPLAEKQSHLNPHSCKVFQLPIIFRVEHVFHFVPSAFYSCPTDLMTCFSLVEPFFTLFQYRRQTSHNPSEFMSETLYYRPTGRFQENTSVVRSTYIRRTDFLLPIFCSTKGCVFTRA